MNEINKKAIIMYFKLTLLATIAFGNVLHTTVFSLPISPDTAASLLSHSMPLAFTYGNIVSLIYMVIAHFILS